MKLSHDHEKNFTFQKIMAGSHAKVPSHINIIFINGIQVQVENNNIHTLHFSA